MEEHHEKVKVIGKAWREALREIISAKNPDLEIPVLEL